MRSLGTIQQPLTAELYAYWKRIRGEHAAPARTDIQPGDIPHILADVFMIDLDPTREFPLLLCGARLEALWLKRQKGSAFLDFWRTEAQRNIAASLLTVIDATMPFVGAARACAPGHPDIEMELLLLPLRKTGAAPARVLGALTPNYQPAWFGQVRAEPLALISIDILAAKTFRSDFSQDSGLQQVTPKRSPPTLVVHEGGVH